MAVKDIEMKKWNTTNAEMDILYPLSMSPNIYHPTSGKTVSDTLIDHVSRMANTETNLVNRGLNVKQFGVKGDGITDDTVALQSAFDSAQKGDKLIVPSGTYVIGDSVKPADGISIEGINATFIPRDNGQHYMLEYTAHSHFEISGITFDQQYRARGAIQLQNCTHFRVINCNFSHYTANYGYYQTDSGLLCGGCHYGLISGNIWTDHGNLESADGKLNRCLTIQNNSDLEPCDHIVISNNIVDNVCQAFAIQGGFNNIFVGNTLKRVNDNSIYALGIDGLTITGNTFNDKTDESIVIQGENFTITGNLFMDVPNKVISLETVTNVTITGNTFRSKNVFSQVLVNRKINTYQLTNINFSGNTVMGKADYTTMSLDNLSGFTCTGNIFDMTFNGDYLSIIHIEDSARNNRVNIQCNSFNDNSSFSPIYGIQIEGTACPWSTVANNVMGATSLDIAPVDINQSNNN